MRCGDARRLISARLDGSLSHGEAASLEKHLAACEACRVQVQQMRSLELRLARPQFVAAPDGFSGRVMARLKERQAIAHAMSRDEGPFARFAFAGMNGWVGFAVVACLLWLALAALVGFAVFLALGGWDWLHLGAFFDPIGRTIFVVGQALLQAAGDIAGSLGTAILLPSAILAVVFCFVWYRLLRRYQWGVQ